MTERLERLPRIRRVRPGPAPHTLIVDWVGGGSDTVDMTGVIARFKPFAPLADAALFCTAHPVDNGVGIGWDGGLDYSGSSLALLAEEQRPMSAAELDDWQKRYALSNSEAAETLGISLRTYNYYRTGRNIPKPVSAFARSMNREPAVFRAHYRPARKAGRPRKHA